MRGLLLRASAASARRSAGATAAVPYPHSIPRTWSRSASRPVLGSVAASARASNGTMTAESPVFSPSRMSAAALRARSKRSTPPDAVRMESVLSSTMAAAVGTPEPLKVEERSIGR